jgi:hypothetical protein
MKIERWGWYSIAVNILLALLHGFIAFGPTASPSPPS